MIVLSKERAMYVRCMVEREEERNVTFRVVENTTEFDFVLREGHRQLLCNLKTIPASFNMQ